MRPAPDRRRHESHILNSDDYLPPADLLAHTDFVRSLAFHLLHDDADADDAAQETLARALKRPPREGPGVRSWLGGVLRNVVRAGWRGDGRRARRERIVARHEALDSSGDATARAEILRRVTEAVRTLTAESREVVLLRHYERLPPRVIASRLGVSTSVVKGRLRRAHERLRELLDEERGGNVEGWRSGLGALVGFDVTKPTVVSVGGGVSVGVATKIGVGITAAVLIGLVGWRLAPRASDEGPVAESTPPRQIGSDELRAPPPLTVRPTSISVAPTATGPVDSSPVVSEEVLTPERLRALQTEVPNGTIEGIVFRGGRRAAHVRVTLEDFGAVKDPSDAAEAAPIEVVTDADGLFRHSGIGADKVLKVWLRSEGISPRWVAWRGDVPSMHRRLVIVLGDGAIRGVLRDRAALPAAAKRVRVTLTNSELKLAGLLVETTTTSDGAYVLNALPVGRWSLSVDLDGGPESKDHDTLEESAQVRAGETVTLDLGPTTPEPLWTGVLRSGGGTAIAGPGSLRLTGRGLRYRATVPFDEQGRFSRRVPADRYRADLAFNGNASRHSLTVEIGTVDTNQDIVLAGSMVSGTVRLDAADLSAIAERQTGFFVEARAEGGAEGSEPISTLLTKDGRFRFLGVRPGRYALRVHRSLPPSLGAETIIDVRDHDITGLELAAPPK